MKSTSDLRKQNLDIFFEEENSEIQIPKLPRTEGNQDVLKSFLDFFHS